MRRSLLALAAACALAVALPSTASAGQYTLHPNGFGTHTYAAWKAQEGLPDSSGNKNQAMYLQKDTLTADFTAAAVRIQGFEGQSTQALLPLGFWWGTDGHCGAGAPRFNVTFQPSMGGPNQTVFIGCQEMQPGATATAPNGRTFEQRTYDGPLPEGTVVQLTIIYDEGIEFPPGHVFLDNIQVGPQVWTSATDNGNG